MPSLARATIPLPEFLHRFDRGDLPPLFAVLDATDEPRVPSMLAGLPDDRARCLWAGNARRDYWAVAPYLARVDRPLLDRIAADLAADPWGVLLASNATFDDLWRHLRRFSWVEDDRGQRMYFRYYDPRVLPPFLEGCDPAQLADFTGPIAGFATLGPAGVDWIGPSARPGSTFL